MGAPISSCARSVIFSEGAPSSFSTRELRAAMPVSSAKHAQGAGRDDQMDATDARVVLEGAQHLDREDGTAGSGDGEDEGGAGGARTRRLAAPTRCA